MTDEKQMVLEVVAVKPVSADGGVGTAILGIMTISVFVGLGMFIQWNRTAAEVERIKAKIRRDVEREFEAKYNDEKKKKAS